jgi:septum formation protein
MQALPQIILASASPRRKELLTKAGYKFVVSVSGINESDFPVENTEPAEYAKRLALAKANNVAADHPDALIIGADTIADVDGKIIGKPKDPKDAEQITRLLFSRPHKIITCLAIVRLRDNLQLVECDTTVVYPRKMSEQQITNHIKSGSWRDKAGAYAIQETGDDFVERIEGSLTNVMGLPVELLEEMLEKVL